MNDATSIIAQRFRAHLGKVFATEMPEGIAHAFYWHAKHLSPGLAEDLASIALLEAIEHRQTSAAPMEEADVRRLLDRVRHRLARSARGLNIAPEDLEARPETQDSIQPEHAARIVKRFIAGISPTDAALFELVCLEGFTPERAAEQLGMPRSTAYRRLAQLREVFAELLSDV